MSLTRRLAFIGNALPRRCGIATFTTDLQQAIAASGADAETCVVAMTDGGQVYDYPAVVGRQVHDERLEDYVLAADFLNAGRFDVVCLQHEFGIFGGEAGEHILALLDRLTMPVVTTLHTVLARPSDQECAVLRRIIHASAKVVVMAEKARSLLEGIYGTPSDKIEVIPHGVPDFPFVEPDAAKAELGFTGRSVILTFGLLSPNKGVETMIEAMPSILERRPDAIYVVLGATHPHLVRQQGEAYRQRLIDRASELGVEGHVVLLDQFVDQATLLGFIAMSDVYVTPYLNEAQMTSGTLAYSFGLGKAVVSTPYWHAAELLAHGKGLLVPFGDSLATGDAVADLLTDHDRREAMRRAAYAASRPMTWARTAERYLEAFDAARSRGRPRVAGSPARIGTGARQPMPELRFDHLLAMTDDTGLFQHAVHSVPDRSHGYCIDDNARALVLTCTVQGAGGPRLPDTLATRFASFIQYAWNADAGRFRNFMGFDRRWLEAVGSEDSHGRALWALGVCARSDADASRRRWATALFAEALGATDSFTSPRAWAFALFGLDAYCEAEPRDPAAAAARRRLADQLMAILLIAEREDWVWFEDGLAYDNARLPQALIITGLALGAPDLIAAGLRSLGWLVKLQTATKGHFRPIGSGNFGEQRGAPSAFDQQPLEATATVSACLAAARASRTLNWQAEADRAFAWFLGENDLSIPLVDLASGGCRDGLHPDRANENRGGESVVSYLLSLAEMQRWARAGAVPTAPTPPKWLALDPVPHASAVLRNPLVQRAIP